MWLLASRGRPSSVVRFFSAWDGTKADSEGVLWIDSDEIDEYTAVCGKLPPKWSVISSPHNGGDLGDICNRFFKMFPDEPWYGLLADDLLPQTPYWDRMLIEAAGTDGLAYGDDGVHGARHATHPCVGGDRIRELGWIALPGCKRIYIDNVLFEDAVKRNMAHYLPHVITEHLHFSNGKSPMDETYRKTHNAQDREIYEAWLSS